MKSEHTLILYDGVCGLCHAFVNFLLRHDHKDQFRFAALQSDFARTIVLRHGGDPEAVSTVYLVSELEREDESIRLRGKAALYALDKLGGAWRIPAILRFLPAFLLNLGYGLVARFRYRLFGKFETCTIPNPEEKAKFLG